MLDPEWDPANAIANIEKHNVTFDEAASAFGCGVTYGTVR